MFIAIKNIAKMAVFMPAILCFSMLMGCASNPNAHPHDPWEPFNRRVSAFNDDVDAVIAKPVATAYKEFLPAFVRTGVNNFFSHLTDPWTVVNSVLQLKPQAAVESFMRFNVNTLFGLGGVLDVASEMKIDKHVADFGQTLGHWGVSSGPFIVLPFLGPSTLRDTLASTLIARGDLVWQLDNVAHRNTLYTLRLVDKRSNLLRTTAVMDAVALDKYTFMRDIFLQVRQSEILDGKVPDEDVSATEKPESKAEPASEAASEPKTDTKPDGVVLPGLDNKSSTGVEMK
jgi:phospholipid-binding lipoprotein MlaA